MPVGSLRERAPLPQLRVEDGGLEAEQRQGVQTSWRVMIQIPTHLEWDLGGHDAHVHPHLRGAEELGVVGAGEGRV